MGLIHSIFNRKKKLELNAVYNSEITQVLSSLGLIDKLEEGKIHCSDCGQQITYDNVGVIYSGEGEVKIKCSSISCVGDEY